MNVPRVNSKTTNGGFSELQKPRGQPNTHWQNYVEDPAWSHLRISPAKLPLVPGDWDAWRSQLELLPPQPRKDK